VARGDGVRRGELDGDGVGAGLSGGDGVGEEGEADEGAVSPGDGVSSLAERLQPASTPSAADAEPSSTVRRDTISRLFPAAQLGLLAGCGAALRRRDALFGERDPQAHGH
jgi:hypothetical protein